VSDPTTLSASPGGGPPDVPRVPAAVSGEHDGDRTEGGDRSHASDEASSGIVAEPIVGEHPHLYTMRLSLSVLDQLGLNLYSNVAAVLSEVGANSWDADAATVSIEINTATGTITVTDDGIGMSTDDLNNRFLYVGYKRRDAGLNITPKGRPVMGRKGIGKLSLFAIADTIRVESAKSGERAGLILKAEDIRAQMGGSDGVGSNPDGSVDPDTGAEVGEVSGK
jgi:histidine kinase/DNA gyrase B/HSP90-like ATPase